MRPTPSDEKEILFNSDLCQQCNSFNKFYLSILGLIEIFEIEHESNELAKAMKEILSNSKEGFDKIPAEDLHEQHQLIFLTSAQLMDCINKRKLSFNTDSFYCCFFKNRPSEKEKLFVTVFEQLVNLFATDRDVNCILQLIEQQTAIIANLEAEVNSKKVMDSLSIQIANSYQPVLYSNSYSEAHSLISIGSLSDEPEIHDFAALLKENSSQQIAIDKLMAESSAEKPSLPSLPSLAHLHSKNDSSVAPTENTRLLTYVPPPTPSKNFSSS